MSAEWVEQAVADGIFLFVAKQTEPDLSIQYEVEIQIQKAIDFTLDVAGSENIM